MFASFRKVLVKSAALLCQGQNLTLTLARPQQSTRMMTFMHHRKVVSPIYDLFGPQTAIQILSRYQKVLYPQKSILSLLSSFERQGQTCRHDQDQDEEQEHGQNHKRTFPGVGSGISGFCLGLTGFLFSKEKLSCEKEEELVSKLKTGILAILDGQSEEAEKSLEQVWELTQDAKKCDDVATQRFDIDLTLLDRLFTILQVASEKMEYSVDECCFLEICTKLGAMLELPITEEMKESLRAGYQFYAGSQFEKIKQAKKDRNELKLVAIYFEILAQAANIMSTLEERDKQSCIKADDKEASKDGNVLRFLEISAHGVTIMVTDETEDGDADVDTLAKDEYGGDDEASSPC